MADQITRPDIDIFYDRKGKSFFDCKEIFREYLEKAGPGIALKDRMEASLQYSRFLIEGGYMAEAEEWLRQCEEYINEHGRAEEKACIINIRAHLAANKANFEEGLTLALRSLYLFQELNIPYFAMNSHVLIGHICAHLNLHDEAIDYLGQAYDVAMQMGDRRQAVMCRLNLNDISMMSTSPKVIVKNIEDLLVSIRDLYKGTPTYPEAGCYLQLAYLYFRMGDVEAAEKYADKGMDISLQVSTLPPHHLQYINLYAVKADIAGAKGDEMAVLEYTDQSVERAKKSQNVAGQAGALFFLTRFYIQQKQLDKAKAHLDEAAQMLEGDKRSDLYMQLNETYCTYYSAIGDSASELRHFKLIYEYKMQRQQEAITNRTNYRATVHELELRKKELAQQKTELDFKTQELNMTTYHLQQRNQLLTDLKENIDELKKEKAKNDVVFKTITKRIDQAFVKEEVEKEHFREKFDETHRSFIARLHQTYPDLSPTECRICALLRSGFNSKEISNLLSTSVRNVENHRVHIRKKMNLTRDENLNLILTQID